MRPAASGDGAVRRKLIAKVHVAKQQLGYDDELYRAVLQRVTGATSSCELSVEQLTALVREFRRLGWEPRSARGKRASSKPQARMIWAIWGEMARLGLITNPSRVALRAFVHKQTGISDPEWLNARQMRSVIEGLKAWRQRKLAEGGGAK